MTELIFVSLTPVVVTAGTAEASVVEVIASIESTTVDAAVEASVAASIAYFVEHPVKVDIINALIFG